MDCIDTWIICITGFTQREGQMTGLEQIQDDIHIKCACPNTRVLLKSWTYPIKDLANRILKRRPLDFPPRVVIIGYSYGGYTAALLAKALQHRGIEVEIMLLIDPVWRPTRIFPSVLSMSPWPWRIWIPRTVNTLYSWRQEVNYPRGHKLNVHPETDHIPAKLKVKHAFADDAPEVREVAMSVCCPDRVNAHCYDHHCLERKSRP